MFTNEELRWKFFNQPNTLSNRMSNSFNLSNLRDDETLNRRNERPSSGPEIDDDLEPGRDGGGGDGIDDGLLPPARTPQPRRPSFTPSNGGPTLPQFPSAGFPVPASPGAGGFDPRVGTTVPGGRVDINVYAQKKTLAQGMMDLALLSANANQLRYVLDFRGSNPYFYVSVVLISMSLLLQISVGIGLILNSRYNIKRDSDCRTADRINNFTIIGIFLVMIINAFITAFAVTIYEKSEFSANLVELHNETAAVM